VAQGINYFKSGLAEADPEPQTNAQANPNAARLWIFLFFAAPSNEFEALAQNKKPNLFEVGFACCPSWIRTNIVGTKNRSPAVRRSGIIRTEAQNYKKIINPQ
jgi:hypothetical protein